VERTHRIIGERVRIILASVGEDLIQPPEFVGVFHGRRTGSHHKIEDQAFSRLYHGYSAEAPVQWVRRSLYYVCKMDLIIIYIMEVVYLRAIFR